MRLQAQKLQKEMRDATEKRRDKAVKDYMARARAFIDEKRYEEALGQLERLLAVDPMNNDALRLKQLLDDTINWRRQLEIQKESDKEELELLIQASKSSIPYSGFPMRLPKDWKELSRRTLGRNWKKFSPEQQKEFTDLFSRLLEGVYADRLLAYSDEKVVFEKETELKKGRVEVASHIRLADGKQVPLNYRMIQKSGKWRVYDVVIEGVTIGLITWVLAIGVSFPISDILLKIISDSMMGSSIDFTFTPEGVAIWLGVVILLSIFASILPARNAARLTINEVLAYE